MRRNKSEIKTLLEKLKHYYVGTIEMFHKCGMDAIYTQDDMGAQTELFMSPQMYRENIAPVFEEIVKVTHDLGMKLILHSCGHVNELFPVWHRIGVDALQFDAPHMTGIDFLKEFVGKFCFHLVPDIQKVYPFVSPDELEHEVKMMIQNLGSQGGLVIRDYMKAVKVLLVPPANHARLPVAVKKWGKY